MELKEAIEKRRSIRKYEEKDVPEALLEDLIRCATLAPSGHNRQPWKFQIIKGELKNKIALSMKKQLLSKDQRLLTLLPLSRRLLF